jgi:hypothetical protein
MSLVLGLDKTELRHWRRRRQHRIAGHVRVQCWCKRAGCSCRWRRNCGVGQEGAASPWRVGCRCEGSLVLLDLLLNRLVVDTVALDNLHNRAQQAHKGALAECGALQTAFSLDCGCSWHIVEQCKLYNRSLGNKILVSLM